MLRKLDIHWIENIQRLFNKVVFSYSLPAVYILLLMYNPLRKGMILTSLKMKPLDQYFDTRKAR